jgi:biotin-(acetyl-CoA carboxylase) ligase
VNVRVDEHLAACDSTQDEVRERLDHVESGELVVVSSTTQHAGRGRAGRTWQDPPGAALMLSVGRKGPLPVSVLERLPRRVADAIVQSLGDPGLLAWKPPNHLVARPDGSTVAGILVDARTTGDHVDHVIIGIGLNLDGEAFVTRDGRHAATLQSVGVTASRRAQLRARLVEQLALELDPERRPPRPTPTDRAQRVVAAELLFMLIGLIATIAHDQARYAVGSMLLVLAERVAGELWTRRRLRR